jgi:hypothetical protein
MNKKQRPIREPRTERDLDEHLWGARDIGEAINRTERQARHLIKTGQLDVTQVGCQFVSTPRRLYKCMGTDV